MQKMLSSLSKSNPPAAIGLGMAIFIVGTALFMKFRPAANDADNVDRKAA